MTLHQFNVMDEMQQAEAVERGTRIGERQDASHDILLYQIDDFYVEAYYCWKYNELVMFKSFSNPDLLQPYLRQINIDKLIGKMSRSRWGMFKRGTTVLLNNYRQFLGIKETLPDRVVCAQFVTILIFLFVVGLSIGHLLASLQTYFLLLKLLIKFPFSIRGEVSPGSFELQDKIVGNFMPGAHGIASFTKLIAPVLSIPVVSGALMHGNKKEKFPWQGTFCAG